ncbi:YDG domain-containing protein [Oxalobacteraceae bacterium OTU3REALA1]|nr:YDG domain-containing protein [Oxalobacteraceae bacterium OTU3REALA1]
MTADLDCQRQRQLPHAGAPLRRKLLFVLVAACYGGAVQVHAAPVNPTVVAGQASFNFQGKTYSITNTPNAIINWQGFSLGADEVARFIQQSADSKVLNRITGQDPSRILGSLQSNGKVFLINPNGVLFGAGSRVDVNGLVASSLAISNADFLAGKNHFAGAANAGKVVNQGTLATPNGGQIFLIAPAVENSGVISSPNGDVVLAAGHSVQLFDARDPNVQVVVSSPADQALNLGSIVAQGGRVGVYGALVNQRGTINADSAVVGANGKIILKSSRTTLLEAGSSTSARGTADGNLNTGGDIVLLGAQVGLTGNAVVDASGGAGGGTVLVGGDYQGKNTALPNAQQTHVGKDSVIRADATGLGDGGKVIVWSDRATQVFGAISARGGAAGGNGGFVETSGHYLDMQGRVDTRAPLGATGTLLLDPSDIYIAGDSGTATAAGMTAGATPSNNNGVFLETTAVADSLLLTSTLQNALATTDVTVTTANSAGTGSGKISVLSPVSWLSTHGLTLNADAGIELKASIDGANAPLHLNAGGAIVQTTSPIDGLRAASLNALAAGNIVLDNTGNTITGVSRLASTGGSASLTADSINLGSSSVASTGTLSVTAAGGDITLGQQMTVAGSLTLNAANNISAPNAVTVGGTFTLGAGSWSQTGALPHFSAADFRLEGGSFVRATGGNGSAATPYLLDDIYGLQGAGGLPASTWFSLNKDIDASGTAGWNAGQGFAPLANTDYPYAGTFNGNGYKISYLTIDRAGSNNVGLFALLGGGTIKNLNLSDGAVRGNANVGGVVGSAVAGAGGIIDDVKSSAGVTGVSNVGGLVGDNGAAISNASAGGAVTGLAGPDAANIGGLAGRNLGSISASSASGAVNSTGFGYVGGLVGSNANDGAHVGAITTSHASGNVTSTGEIVGGLVGDNNGGVISIAYAIGDVQGGRNVGGLAGRNNILNGIGGTIANVYASGDVSGNLLDVNLNHANMGGLIGDLFSGTVGNSYSGGAVDGQLFSGGVSAMVGTLGTGTISNGYFNADAAGSAYDIAGTGLTDKQSQQQSSYAGFDFSTVWRNYDGHTAPLLKSFLTSKPIAVSGGGNGVTKTYDGASAAFTGSATGVVAGINGTLGYDGAVNVGTYEVGGLWSTQYDITYTGTAARLVIQPRTVTATVTGTKTYDGVAYMEQPATYTFSNLVGGDTLGVSGLVSFSDKNAGVGKAMSVANATLTNNDFGNYVLGGAVGGSGSITKAPLALSGLSAVSRQYDGTTVAQLGGSASVAGFYGDDVALAGVVGGTATFSNKNVGTGKLVTVNAGGLSLTGADAANYVLVSPSDLSADITPATLTVAGLTANHRVYNLDYDSTTASYGRRATLSNGTLGGVIGNDQVAIGGASASFADKNAGTAKSVTVNGIALSGADSGNYVVGNLPTGLTADITPAALTVSLAARDYNNNAAATLTGATLSGVLSTAGGSADAVSLAANGATATYADKNAGVDKVVTLGGGAGLSGADAGNYTLAAAKGTITPRALATWTASGGGAWSDAANWQDGVAPSAANVLAAALDNAGGIVTYDSGAGATTLTSLRANGQGVSVTGGALTLTGGGADASYANGGGLMLGGGALVVNGHMQISNLVLSGGVLSGTGAATQVGIAALAQSGGAIDIDGALAVGNGGNIAIGNARAKAGITLNAAQGGITQTGALVTDSLHAFAANGIALTDAGNQVGAFEAIVNGAGNIALNNTVSGGELALGTLSTSGNIIIDNVGGIHTTGDIAGAGGLVSITAHSPITVDNQISAATILLDASSDIMLSKHSELNAGAAIGLTAGRNIQLGGKLRVPSSGRIAATAATGNITSLAGTTFSSGGGPVTLTTLQGSIDVRSSIFIGQTTATLNDGAADAAAKAAADAAAKAAADAAAKAAADAAAQAAAEAAAKAAADAAAKAAAEAAAQAAAEAAVKAAAEAAAQAAADAAAKAAAEAAAKAAADAAAQAAADAAAKAAADAAAKAVAEAAAVVVATQGRPSEPVGQALNATVNVINTATATTSQLGVAGRNEAKPSETHNGGSAPDKEKAIAAGDGGTATAGEKIGVAKKTYCN